MARQEGMILTKYAKNGATIMDAGYSGGQILSQIMGAAGEEPDFILFDGGTNDAEYLKNNTEGFDTAAFAGAFEETAAAMKQRWPGAKYVYVAVHRMGSRDNEIQEKLHELEMQICKKWNITVVNLYEDAALDTNDVNQKNHYTFDNLGSNGLPSGNGSGTHPNLLAIEEFYAPKVRAALRSLLDTRADKQGLELMISAAEKLSAGDYSADSWEVLTEKLDAARTTAADDTASQSEVDRALKELAAAFRDLKTGLITAAADAIAAAAEECLQETGNYRPADVQKVKDALQILKDALADENTNQEQLNSLTMELLDALINLKEQVDVDRLLQALELAAGFQEEADKYTSSSAEALENAVNDAKAVIADEDRTYDEVADSYAALIRAIAQMERRGDKSALIPLVEKAQEILAESGKYAAPTLEGLEEALSDAEAVCGNEDALQAEVDAATVLLAGELAQVRLLGDVNHDGKVDSADSVCVLRVNAELDELDTESAAAADVNGDSVIDTADAVLIQKYAAELISEF